MRRTTYTSGPQSVVSSRTGISMVIKEFARYADSQAHPGLLSQKPWDGLSNCISLALFNDVSCTPHVRNTPPCSALIGAQRNSKSSTANGPTSSTSITKILQETGRLKKHETWCQMHCVGCFWFLVWKKSSL